MKEKLPRSSADALDLVGADANNLKYVDLEIPRHGVTAIVGASGSGKSSILAETLAAEGARRRAVYLNVDGEEHEEVRAWLGPMPATVHVGQRAFRASARTTVATATGLLSRVRRLFVSHSVPWADPPGEAVAEPNAPDWAEWIVRNWRGRAVVWAVPLRFEASTGERAIARLRAEGVEELVVRSETDRPAVWSEGRRVGVAKFRALDPKVRHIVEARIGDVDVQGARTKEALRAILERAFRAAAGKVVVELPGNGDADLQGPFGPRLDAEIHRLHPKSPTVFFAPSSHLLSFNAPEHYLSGACRVCRGTGRATQVLEQALVTEPRRSMHGGAFSLWTEKNYRYVNIQHETIEGLRGLEGFDPDKPWRSLPESARRLVLDGAAAPVQERDRKTGRAYGPARRFEGFRKAIVKRATDGAAATAARLAHLVNEGECSECGGSRWSGAARALRVGGIGLDAILDVGFGDLSDFLASNLKKVPREVQPLLRAIDDIAKSLSAVGLGHLSGARGMTEVSSGESRRIRLAGVLDTSLEDLLVLLDEPARGLHEEDVEAMAKVIRQMSARHTVVISDHRAGLMRAVDHVVDMGIVGGPAGGVVRSAGPAGKTSLKALGLARERSGKARAWLSVSDAKLHSLRGVDVKIPLGQLTCITGPSGSGKSTFVRGILVPAVAAELPPQAVQVDDFDVRGGGRYAIDGVQGAVRSLIALDQRVPTTNRRSLALTFLGVGDDLRAAFAASDDARKLKLDATDFGLNAGHGRCESCLGLGVVESVGGAERCSRCGGLRYGPRVLSVALEGWTIDRLLDATIDELLAALPRALASRQTLLSAVRDLGLGFVSLGRRVDSLSGGELQRLRIARVLGGETPGGSLFVLDEPAAGLHPSDVERLAAGVDRMLSAGSNTVVLVEHNLALISAADHLIEFGPGSGPHGGRVVAKGTPTDVSKTNTATGRALANSKHAAAPLAPPTSIRAVSSRPSRAMAMQARAELRRLLGHDIAESSGEQSDPARLGVVFDSSAAEKTPVWEIGGLAHELALLSLESIGFVDTPEARERMLSAWRGSRASHLQIRPFLGEVQVWGRRVPRSVQRLVLRNLEAVGLTLANAVEPGDALTATAIGGRLVPTASSDVARAAALEHALTLGFGHVELVESEKRVRCALSVRPLDLKRGLVGPARPCAAHFLRAGAAGRCSVCQGRGQVQEVDDSLIIRTRSAPPADQRWLTSEALALLRGKLRSEFIPFLRRIADEGIAEVDVAYSKLEARDRQWLLFGFWHRPGPGTFLKTGKDPSEVGSWLRWDGLYREVLAELDRSKDAAWQRRVRESARWRECPECRGTGLGESSELVVLGGRTLRELVRTGSGADLLRALSTSDASLGLMTRRHAARRGAVMASLRAMSATVKGALAQPATPDISRSVLEGLVLSHTTVVLADG